MISQKEKAEDDKQEEGEIRTCSFCSRNFFCPLSNRSASMTCIIFDSILSALKEMIRRKRGGGGGGARRRGGEEDLLASSSLSWDISLRSLCLSTRSCLIAATNFYKALMRLLEKGGEPFKHRPHFLSALQPPEGALGPVRSA